MLKLVQASNDLDNILTTQVEDVESQKEADEVSMQVRVGIRLFPNLVGLAANQIGINKRVCVVLLKADTDCAHWLTMVNPVITKKGEYERTEIEGCGSLREPEELYYSVTRPWEITVQFQNPIGEWVSLDLQGFDARVVQHEVDHLDGILISDKGVKVDRPS